MTDTATALIREAAERLHDARREALHAEADRIQRVSLDDLLLADDEAERRRALSEVVPPGTSP